MEKIKVLIVDDSALMREALTRILSKDSEVEVVGTAPDPYIAVDKIKRLKPDVLTLDIEMPKMDGLTFLEKLMKAHPMPVVMISTWTSANSEKAIEALRLGAVDCIEKPSSNVQSRISEMDAEIAAKVKAAAKYVPNRNAAKFSASVGTKLNIQSNIDKSKAIGLKSKSDKIILIGASTGGTIALEVILKDLRPNLPGIVVVQHMPENFTKAFAERLDALYNLHVKEAENGETIYDNTVYIAPGGKQCYVRRVMGHYTIEITDDPPVNRHKPSVDALFYSAAEYNCSSMTTVILTGMGRDGAQGMAALKKAGCYNIAQDEATCVVFGMPKEAIDLGAADEVIGLGKIALRLMSINKER